MGKTHTSDFLRQGIEQRMRMRERESETLHFEAAAEVSFLWKLLGEKCTYVVHDWRFFVAFGLTLGARMYRNGI